MTDQKPRIAVAMSGGVDSSVAAARLVAEGYDVVGLFAKTWTPAPGDGTVCTWVADRRDALRVAAHLRIPLVTIDAEAAYRTSVLEPWVAGYGRGETPNPDVWCNRTIKFGLLLAKARELGATALATGHYARIQDSGNPKVLRGRDRQKDQSYFLWDIPAGSLPLLRFPIGHLTKPQVRQLAVRFGLPVADKKDSQGICLLGPTDIRTFLRRRLPARPGPIYDWETGRLLGFHPGLPGLTIGQRHGIRRSAIADRRSDRDIDRTDQAPRYIIAMNVARNCLWIGPASALVRRQVTIWAANWLSPEPAARLSAQKTVPVTVQVRYQGDRIPARLQRLPGGTISVRLSRGVVAPAAGQSAVFYQGDRLVGGAIIHSVPHSQPTFSQPGDSGRTQKMPPMSSHNRSVDV